MDEAMTPSPQGIARFKKHMILGAVFGGVLSVIPLLNFLNCLFCVLNMAGVVFALNMYLKANPADTLTIGESVWFGAIAGAGAGLIVGIGNIFYGASIAALFSSITGGSMMGSALSSGAFSILGIPVSMVMYAAFGLLGTFLGMKLFFKDRIRNA